MIGAEIVEDPKTKEPAIQEVRDIMNRCFRNGLAITATCKSTMRFAPPLTLTQELIDEGLESPERCKRNLNSSMVNT